MDLELTGERTLPGIARENYWYRRHVAAYRFAAHLARGHVVDAGAGEGYGAALLARRARVTALELDPDAAVHAACRYPGAWFLRADVARLPLAERSVDAIVALQVLEHLPSPGRFLEGCRRALRPTGILVVSTPNRDTFPTGENPFHVHEYDPAELEALLEEWFTDVTVLGLRHRRPLAALDRTLGRPVQHVLATRPYEDLPLWVRAVLRTVRSWDFRIDRSPASGLDLVAVAHP